MELSLFFTQTIFKYNTRVDEYIVKRLTDPISMPWLINADVKFQPTLQMFRMQKLQLLKIHLFRQLYSVCSISVNSCSEVLM